MSLDELLPAWQFRERHRRATTAPAAALLTGVERVTWAEVPVMRGLMAIRSTGRLPLPASHRIIDDMTTLGFTVVRRSADQLVMAALGRLIAPPEARAALSARGDEGPPRLAEQADPAGFFAGFSEPGWAKIAADFRVGDGELTTETRVLATDERSRRAFRRYWLFIRPFSGLIRRRWLAAIVRRAEHQVHTG